MALLDFGLRTASAPVLIAEGLLLRLPQLEDHAAWVALREASRAHLTAWEHAWRGDEMSAASFRRRVRNAWSDARRGVGASFNVFRQSDDALVGGIALSNIRYGPSRSAGVGYWIGTPYVRQGFGTAALSAVVDYAFNTLDLNRLEAACQPENVASLRLLERVGFVREGLARDYLRINGAWRDHFLYALTARQVSSSGR